MSLLINLANPRLDPPLLSAGFAIGACTLFTFSYVASLYVSPAGRVMGTTDASGKTVDRDHPVVIRARIKTASLATALTVVATGVVLWVKRIIPRSGWLLDTLNAARLLGLPLPVPSVLSSSMIPLDPPLANYLAKLTVHVGAPLLLTAMLFLGPLYVAFLDQQLPLQRYFCYRRDVVDKFTSLTGIRNYLVGPLTEELVFRCTILTPLLFSGVSRTKLILLTPAFFAIAHAHHAYNVWLQGGRTKHAALTGLLTATLQLCYTGVFGWYANFLFLRSASVVAPFGAHVWCNLMGLPDPVGAEQRHAKSKWLIWSVHAIGIVLFAKCLFPLTSSAVFGGSLYW
ncbi:CAAX prenyl protease [Mycosarcoma maydis]|uniref:intramembrane prenyl-peptidase Rce1 n=1 Tax=Mycosarcoma maydis TaxID=5270 RepID=A0A0D1CFM1_MYCMD|nr:CAAX prenyl protease [Ustilago maydis 521]KIS65833.1 hypothetical protein UMAG_11228 [Ustilago maydis 521]|eukprot:XP_011392627.1 hypothetical protein UMAG_11228 [Ustilago maydis 521]